MRKLVAPLLILAAVAFSIAVWSRLPERMPLHWGLDGEVNGYGNRAQGAFLLPGLMLLIWVLMRFLPRIDPRRANYAKFADTYDLLLDSFVALFAVMHVALIGAALGWPVSMARVAPALIGLQFIIIGNASARATQLVVRHPHAVDAQQRPCLGAHASGRRVLARRCRCRPSHRGGASRG